MASAAAPPATTGDRAAARRSKLQAYYGLKATEGGDGSSSTAAAPSPAAAAATSNKGKGKGATAAASSSALDQPGFDAAAHVAGLLRTGRIKDLLEKDAAISHEADELDRELQMLVYGNYSNFISATQLVGGVRERAGEMSAKMQTLQATMARITDRHAAVQTALKPAREEMLRVASVDTSLKKIEYLVHLPERLARCADGGDLQRGVEYWRAGSAILRRNTDVAAFRSVREACLPVVTRLDAALVARVVADGARADARAYARLLAAAGGEEAEAEAATKAHALQATLRGAWTKDAAEVVQTGGGGGGRAQRVFGGLLSRLVEMWALCAEVGRGGGGAKETTERDADGADAAALAAAHNALFAAAEERAARGVRAALLRIGDGGGDDDSEAKACTALASRVFAAARCLVRGRVAAARAAARVGVSLTSTTSSAPAAAAATATSPTHAQLPSLLSRVLPDADDLTPASSDAACRGLVLHAALQADLFELLTRIDRSSATAAAGDLDGGECLVAAALRSLLLSQTAEEDEEDDEEDDAEDEAECEIDEEVRAAGTADADCLAVLACVPREAWEAAVVRCTSGSGGTPLSLPPAQSFVRLCRPAVAASGGVALRQRTLGFVQAAAAVDLSKRGLRGAVAAAAAAAAEDEDEDAGAVLNVSAGFVALGAALAAVQARVERSLKGVHGRLEAATAEAAAAAAAAAAGGGGGGALQATPADARSRGSAGSGVSGVDGLSLGSRALFGGGGGGAGSCGGGGGGGAGSSSSPVMPASLHPSAVMRSVVLHLLWSAVEVVRQRALSRRMLHQLQIDFGYLKAKVEELGLDKEPALPAPPPQQQPAGPPSGHASNSASASLAAGGSWDASLGEFGAGAAGGGGGGGGGGAVAAALRAVTENLMSRALPAAASQPLPSSEVRAAVQQALL